MLTDRLDIGAGAIDHPDAVGGAVGGVEPLGAGGADGDQAEVRALREDGGGDGEDGGDGDGGGEEAREEEGGRRAVVAR